MHRLEEQISLVWQVPQVSLQPQPSSRVPQFLPAEAQVLGAQLLHRLEEQISLVWQVPQVSLLPQPSSMVPQFLPAETQVCGVQVTHLLSVQTLPPVHEPQSCVTAALQWSPTLPHSAPDSTHSRGACVPPLAQGQLITPPQPSDSVPQVVDG